MFDWLPYDWRPREVWYRLKCWAWHRYTTVKPRTTPWNTWTDKCYLLPHLMFEVLAQFVEDELTPGDFEVPADVDDRSANRLHWVKMHCEMRDLLEWWRTVYLRADEVYQAFFEEKQKCRSKDDTDEWQFDWKFDSPEMEERHRRLVAESAEFDRVLQRELIRRMMRLVRVHPYMWT